MNTEFYYQVAGHTYQLTIPEEQTMYLANYKPFIADKADNLLFHLILGETPSDEEKQVGCFSGDTATIEVYTRSAGGFLFYISPPGKERCCVMATSTDYKLAYTQLEGDPRYQFFAFNNCLMLLYTFTSALRNTLMMHASVVKHKGKGYIFLGKSGTGKSTHSHLWLKNIDECELLNDDNPVVRILDGKAVVFGSPWSGKTPCYKNDLAWVGAFIRLQQKPENHIELNSLAQAFAILKSSCSTAPWDNAVHNGICNTLTTLLQQVNTYILGCRPDKEAALLCSQTVIR